MPLSAIAPDPLTDTVNSISGWNELLQSTFGAISVRAKGAGDFLASLKQIRMGGSIFFECESSPAIVTHTPNETVSDGDFLIKTQLAGSSVVSVNGEIIELEPGDYMICDNSKPYSLMFERSTQIVSAPISKDCLQKITPFPIDVCFSKVAASNPLKGVVGDYLKSLYKNDISDASGVAKSRLVEMYFELAVMSIVEQRKGGVRVRCGTNNLFHRCCAYIKETSSNDRLSVGDIALALGISVRYLQEIFAEHGKTVTDYLAQVRLQEARNILFSDSFDGRSIGEIAYAVGFKSHAHFSRAFKLEFGCSPTEYRRRNHCLNDFTYRRDISTSIN